MPEESEEIVPQTGTDTPTPCGEIEAASPGADVESDARADAQRGDDPAGEMVSRAELEKVIAQRQAAKTRARKAESRLAELETRLDAEPAPAPDQADREDADARARALGEQNRKLQRQLTNVLRDQGLHAAAAAAGAVNPDQVVALLRPRVQMQEVADGRMRPMVLDDDGLPVADESGEPVDMPTFVSLFLSLPENANLVRSAVTPGSGARPAGGAPALDGRPRSLEEFNDLPEPRRMQWAMELGPAKLRALLGLSRPGDRGFL